MTLACTGHSRFPTINVASVQIQPQDGLWKQGSQSVHARVSLGVVRYKSSRSLWEQLAQGEVNVYTTQICLPNSEAGCGVWREPLQFTLLSPTVGRASGRIHGISGTSRYFLRWEREVLSIVGGL